MGFHLAYFYPYYAAPYPSIVTFYGIMGDLPAIRHKRLSMPTTVCGDFISGPGNGDRYIWAAPRLLAWWSGGAWGDGQRTTACGSLAGRNASTVDWYGKSLVGVGFSESTRYYWKSLRYTKNSQ